MRRLLVAAAVSLASASEPFSWADAQNAMHACTNGSRPLVDKYAYLSTRHPLGNALSGWMHVFLYALAWSVGSLLETEDRFKFDEFLRSQDNKKNMPNVKEGETIYEYMVDEKSTWQLWRPPAWTYPEGDKLDFSNLLVPTMDSTRALYISNMMLNLKKPVMLVGNSGSAKTVVFNKLLADLDEDLWLYCPIAYNSFTISFDVQGMLEAPLSYGSLSP